MQRSLLLFENSLKTEATRKMYLYFLDKFKNFYKLQNYDSIIAMGESELQIMVEDYVMMLKKRIGANSMRTYMAGIQAFLETNDIELRWRKIHRLFPAKTKKTGGMKSLMEQTVEWENILLRSIQIGPIDAGLENLEAQGLIRKKSNRKCLYDYELTDDGKYSLEEYRKTVKLR